MKQVSKYISEILGIETFLTPITKMELGNLPMYITQSYKLYSMEFFAHELILVELNDEENISILQIDKHIQTLKNNFNKIIIIAFENLLSYNRKRLIEKRINFIVPGKQMYLPELLTDLHESFPQQRTKPKGEKLLPSAQLLLFYHIVNRYKSFKLEEHPFKEIARKLGYTAMAITNAVEDLKYHNFIEVRGEREKFIKFNLERSELWYAAERQNLLSNPVIKTLYVDILPHNTQMLKSNASALPEYSNMNPSSQLYYAIERNAFYKMKKKVPLVNANEYEGKYAIEVWKYNPQIIIEDMNNDRGVVDPLSLFLSLKDSHDERVEMALERIIERYIW